MLPKSFELGGHMVKVKIVKDLYSNADCYGRWTPSLNQIEVQAVNKEVSASFQLQTFWHEVVHALLEVHCYEKLSKDENLVDRLGQGLHQVIRTLK